MTRVERYKAEHAKSINRQNHDAIELSVISDEQFKAVETCKHAYSIYVNDSLVACFGVVQHWAGRCEAWAIIDKYAGSNMISVVRTMNRLADLVMVDFHRIEATVMSTFEQGHRLVKLLKFELEAPLMRKYGVTGLDYSLYARVRQ